MLAAGIAGLMAGALSMAVGEYVSVSTQRDTERALIELERRDGESVAMAYAWDLETNARDVVNLDV